MLEPRLNNLADDLLDLFAVEFDNRFHPVGGLQSGAGRLRASIGPCAGPTSVLKATGQLARHLPGGPDPPY